MIVENSTEQLLAAVPLLECFERFEFGHAHIEARWCHITDPVERVAVVAEAARFLQVPVQTMAGGSPRYVSHWLVADRLIVAATVCECHDGLEATVGHFPDRSAVIARATGEALRGVFPPALHPGIAAAEVVIDVELALRGVQ
jgi:hypothetical protein